MSDYIFGVTPASNNPSAATTNTYTGEGLPYTSALAGSPNCLYVYVESTTNRFNFSQTKAPSGSTAPKAFNSMHAMNEFRNKNAGVLVIFQDGTAGWNFSE